ncbi:MAG: MarR family transcriptional regulator [Syntrophomonadaceae bacterium]|nr:MarR family transcriptional regulator [Syntrophomonadaceae bacterium]
MEDFTTFVCYQLKATMKKVERYIGQELNRYGVNLAQSFVLFSLLENNGATLSEIGVRAQIENSSLTTMVDKLEKEDLVERRLYPQDRRVVRLFLTDKGRETAHKILSQGKFFNNYLIENMSSESADFLKSLEEVSGSIDTLQCS